MPLRFLCIGRWDLDWKKLQFIYWGCEHVASTLTQFQNQTGKKLQAKQLSSQDRTKINDFWFVPWLTIHLLFVSPGSRHNDDYYGKCIPAPCLCTISVLTNYSKLNYVFTFWYMNPEKQGCKYLRNLVARALLIDEIIRMSLHSFSVVTLPVFVMMIVAYILPGLK